MRCAFSLLGVLMATLTPFAARAADPAPLHCAAPAEFVQDDPQLSGIATDLQKHQPIVIVAIGGASTAGVGPEDAYPHFLEEALHRRHPGQPITVINRGKSGETAEEMAARFPKDVYPNHPTLVIWETGTVDAVRGEDIDSLAGTLSDGIDAIKSHGAEMMLMDMQYNPGTVSVINFEPYLDALHQTAQLQDVYMFKRYDLMKYWSDAGAFDFIGVPKEKRAALAREYYECLGERLADAIDYAAR
jgi:lysophospholipase L1-like esterase